MESTHEMFGCPVITWYIHNINCFVSNIMCENYQYFALFTISSSNSDVMTFATHICLQLLFCWSHVYFSQNSDPEFFFTIVRQSFHQSLAPESGCGGIQNQLQIRSFPSLFVEMYAIVSHLTYGIVGGCFLNYLL